MRPPVKAAVLQCFLKMMVVCLIPAYPRIAVVVGPDDADDDGACPGGGRKDNMDNPDSVYDDGTCGSGYISGGGNYNGPDGSSSYDEFH